MKTKMKKITLLILAAAMLAVIAACGADFAGNAEQATAPDYAEEKAWADDADGYVYDYNNLTVAFDTAAEAPMAGGGGSSYPDRGEYHPEPIPMPAEEPDMLWPEPEPVPSAIAGDKIIYSAHASLETLEFDASVAALEAMIRDLGGYTESSSLTGTPIDAVPYSRDGYRQNVSFRSAYYTVRIPATAFEHATNTLNGIGNVLSLSTYATNITAQYVDNESRLNMYRTEETSLLNMLARADNVYDMILIEQRLSEARYNIERLTTNLRSMDTQVQFSTLTVYISEVEQLTEIREPYRSYGQQIADGFAATLRGIGRFFASLAKYFIIYLPVIAILAVCLLVLALVLKRFLPRRAPASAKNEIKIETDDSANE